MSAPGEDPRAPPLRSFLADRGDERERLDRVLVRHLADLPLARVEAARWIRAGKVRVGGEPALRAARRMWKGEEVVIELPPPPADKPALVAQAMALAVVYEDEHLLVVDKPPGLVVHPTWGHRDGTLLNGLLWRARDWEAGAPSTGSTASELRPRLVHRLDKDTSGLLLVSKTRAGHRGLARAMQLRQVRKEYLALARGRPAAQRGRIELAIGRDPEDMKRRIAGAADGRPSVTAWELLGEGSIAGVELALLRCRLETGRTHQIRVHLAAVGLPLVGDPLYGPGGAGGPGGQAGGGLEGFRRQALHAWRLELVHPVTRAPLVLAAALPGDLRELLAGAGIALPDQQPAVGLALER